VGCCRNRSSRPFRGAVGCGGSRLSSFHIKMCGWYCYGFFFPLFFALCDAPQDLFCCFSLMLLRSSCTRLCEDETETAPPPPPDTKSTEQHNTTPTSSYLLFLYGFTIEDSTVACHLPYSIITPPRPPPSNIKPPSLPSNKQ
jgi:hypothetical protein